VFGAQTIYAFRALSGEPLALLPLTVALVETLRGTVSTGTTVTIISGGLGVAGALAVHFLFAHGSRRAPVVRVRWAGRHRAW
ncbi:hypothetical protein ACSTKI_00105, partial [Vibrio parahaemolyticus]